MQLNDPFLMAEMKGNAARLKAIQAMPPIERAAFDKDQEECFARKRRGLVAYLRGNKAPQPRRRMAERPKASRQYVTMQTTVLRDASVSKTAAVLMGILCALAGATGHTYTANAGLCTLLNRSLSTVKRCLHDLVEEGYVVSELIHNQRGSVVGRRLTPTDKAWPYWHPKRQNPEEDCRPIIAPHKTIPMKGASFERAEGLRMDAEGRPNRRWGCGKLGNDGG